MKITVTVYDEITGHEVQTVEVRASGWWTAQSQATQIEEAARLARAIIRFETGNGGWMPATEAHFEHGGAEFVQTIVLGSAQDTPRIGTLRIQF